MTSRERVLKALRHEEPDRVPYDLSSTPVTGIHRVAYTRLRSALGLPEREPVIWHTMQQLAWVDDDVHEAMRTDATGLRPLAPSSWVMEQTEDEDYYYFTDEWGMTRRRQRPDGYYFDLCSSPLADATGPKDVESFSWPDSVDDGRFVGIRERAEQAQAGNRVFILGGICAGMLEMGLWLRGFENFFCDLAGNRALAEAICDKIIELKMQYWEKVLPLVGDLVDIIQEGDDYGGQNGLLVSPKVWREIFRPRLATLLSHIKKLKPDASIFFHSCGSVREIIPDLIELGVDILNPVQVAAADMDSRQLKKDFGDDLTFWGGGADTQGVLPEGTPQEVREEVRRRLDDLAPGGGFVFNTVHNIQADVSPENILAMREALEEFGGYR
ncbi:MAG: uroporphyrinogen decarboxylase family protein [Planctomycetota bacterium]|jgi:uroporphyrinogen decarboxylase|nr:uroporphyrinogen decarboxylase family protein [Planctomycetota bacterium]MDP7249925.1 uroporphyrinogen decarboxylase family protein [Planctomycetota bacterium]